VDGRHPIRVDIDGRGKALLFRGGVGVPGNPENRLRVLHEGLVDFFVWLRDEIRRIGIAVVVAKRSLQRRMEKYDGRCSLVFLQFFPQPAHYFSSFASSPT
jgi:hypothetical protein